MPTIIALGRRLPVMVLRTVLARRHWAVEAGPRRTALDSVEARSTRHGTRSQPPKFPIVPSVLRGRGPGSLSGPASLCLLGWAKTPSIGGATSSPPDTLTQLAAWPAEPICSCLMSCRRLQSGTAVSGRGTVLETIRWVEGLMACYGKNSCVLMKCLPA